MDTEPKTRRVKEEEKEKIATDKYNIGTLKMYIAPDLLQISSSGQGKKRKLHKIYYKRSYTETPSELQQAQKTLNTIQPKVSTLPQQPQPQPQPQPVPTVAPQAPQVKGQLGGRDIFDSSDSYDSSRDRDRDRDRDRGRERERNSSLDLYGRSSNYGESLTSRVNYDAEPFISSLIKFSSSGFPSNSTIKSQVDTFFNIKLFRSYLKKLGEPIKLYNNENKTVPPTSIDILNNKTKATNANDSKNKTAQDTDGNSIKIWSPNAENLLIGSTFSFIFTKPSDQEMRQLSDIDRRKLNTPSLLMIRDGNDYRLIGGKIDNTTRALIASATSVSTGFSHVTKPDTVNKTITKEFTEQSGSQFPGTVGGTSRNLLYTPNNVITPDTLANETTNMNEMRSVIYSGQVDTNRVRSILQNSKNRTSFGTGELVMMPISNIYNIVTKNVSSSIIEGKISLTPQQETIIKLTIELLEKQNILPRFVGEKKQSNEDIIPKGDREKELLKSINESSIGEINSIVKHNIKFILNIIFSNKTTFKYENNSYMVDYVDWNNDFSQIQQTKLPKNVNIGYYIELELFLEKLEKGKLPIDSRSSFLGSCAIKGARIKSDWKRHFIDQDWSKVAEKISDAFTSQTAPNVTNILPDFVKQAMAIDSDKLMSPPMEAGVTQISLVQYSFLGQEELIKGFNNIQNSYAGVSWKNSNSWDRRKQRLFNAMDSCNADVYCFQNVQCSLNSYKKIVQGLSQHNQELLSSIEVIDIRPRINLYRNTVMKALLEDTSDPNNLVAQLYEKYSHMYEFTYFFEQKFIHNSGALSGIVINYMEPDYYFPDSINPIALGNLTMVNKYKFEIREVSDIYMAPAIYSKKNIKVKKMNTTLLSIDGQQNIFDPLFNDKSFATVTYCYFTDNINAPTSSTKPGVIGTSGVTAASSSSQVKKRVLPGLQSIPNFKPSETEDLEKIKKAEKSNPLPVDESDTEEGNAEGENEETGSVSGESQGSSKDDNDELYPEDNEDRDEGRDDGTDDGMGGGNNETKEWYEKDNTEDEGYTNFLSSFIKKFIPVVKTPKGAIATPCVKYNDPALIPNGQIFGIINIKLDSYRTEKNAKNEFEKRKEQLQKQKQPVDNLTPPLTKAAIEVFLISAFMYRFRLRYFLSGSTDDNPIFISGDFNFNFPYTNKIQDIYSKIPALKLMLSKSKTKMKGEDYKEILGEKYWEIIDKFILQCQILNYLYGGEKRVGRFRLIGYENNTMDYNLFGNTISLSKENFNKQTTTQFIFSTRKLKLCPKEEINKMMPQEEKDDLPDFPDNVNPSNSNAIGGIFEISTSAVNQLISQHIAEQELQKQSEEGADISAILSSIQEEDGDEEEEGEGVQTDDVSSGIAPSSSSSSSSSSSGTSSAVDKPDFTKSSKSTSDRTKLVATVVTSKDANNDLSFFDSPYPRYVSICDTGKDVDDYLTMKDMKTWKTTDADIFSDHAPIKYDIDSSVDGNGKHKCGQDQAGGGDGIESVMVGGIGNIKLITWNVAGLGGQGADSKGKVFYYHKFIGEVKETDDLYKQRIRNNTKAISNMMNSGSGYDYTLIQEGPTENSAIAVFTQEVASNNLNVLRGGINMYNTQFYLITKKSDKSRYSVSGVIKIKGKPAIAGKSAKPAQILYTSDGFAQTIFKEMKVNLNKQYSTDDFEKDFSSLWFFINETKKQILISVHFPLDPDRLQFTDQRQDEIYSLLNSIVTFIRLSKYPVMIPYRDFDIVFAGDYNINMIERIPNNIRPVFLRCSSIPEQETLIYTSKDNAPSSFGGDNKGEYNPTNIDFAIYYPNVTLKPASVVKTAVATKSKLSGSMISSISSSSSVAKVVDITINKQKEIFKLSTSPPQTGLENFVSVLATTYNQVYSSQKIMPPGSATLLDISKLDFHTIRYDAANDVSTTDNIGIKAGVVKYMIQASPAMSGGVLITRDTLSNSVMNSLILATQNNVKKIMIPFIGGNLFKVALQKVVPNYSMDEHAKILIEGVIKYNYIIDKYKVNDSINEIMFCIYDKEKQSVDKAIRAENLSKQVKTSSGQTNIINETVEQYKNGIVFDAIVNAANAELQFGTGVSGMCYAAIDDDNNSQVMLTAKKFQFIRAFNVYFKSTGVSSVSPGTKPAAPLGAPIAPGTSSALGAPGAPILPILPSSTGDVTKIFPVLGLGIPRGFVSITGDKYETWIEPGDIKNPQKFDKLHITTFYYDAPNYLPAFFAGTKLLYYDTKVIKDAATGTDYTWYKCWFSLNTTSFLISASEILNIYKLTVLNPLGAGGMFVWLPYNKGKTKTINYIIPYAFDPSQAIAVTKFLDDCKKNIQKEINDVKIKFIKDTMAAYDAGNVFLSDKFKKALQQMDASLKLSSKPFVSSPAAPPLPVSPAASPVLKSLEKVLVSDTKKKRASIQNFEDMQTKITGRPNFDTAFNEILQGRKRTHWIWYIIPSDINNFSSDESLFYGIGSNASALGNTQGLKVVTVSEYLNNSILRGNYIKIINEIGKQSDKYQKANHLTDVSQDLKKFLINLMGGYDASGRPVDYNKLTSSVLNFHPEMVTKKIITPEIDYLYKILKYFYDEDRKGKAAPGKVLPVAPVLPGKGSPEVPTIVPPIAPVLDKSKGARIISLSDIIKIIVAGKDDSIFVVNGGSFNPPHNGHIQTFDLAAERLKRDGKFSNKKIYGIIVASDRNHLVIKKGLPINQYIPSNIRMQLCKLATDSYNWKTVDFNSNNIFILDVANNAPVNLIIKNIQDQNPSIQNMFYLSGSDYYLEYYSKKSMYNIIYVLRNDGKEVKDDDIKSKTNKYYQIPIRNTDKVTSELSSTTIRNLIRKLQPGDYKSYIQTRTQIVNNIGLTVYCALKDIQYLGNKQNYGNICDDKPEITKEADEGIEIAKKKKEARDAAAAAVKLKEGQSKQDEEQDKKEFDEFMITPQGVFRGDTQPADVDKNINEIVKCIKDGGNRFIVSAYLKDQVYASGVYYILNDLYYFTNNPKSQFFESNKNDCIPNRLLSNGANGENLLNNMALMTSEQFNILYLSDERTVNDIHDLKKEFIKNIASTGVNANLASNVLDYLYNSQRYSIFIYLIRRDSPAEGKQQLIILYNSLFNKIKEKEDDKIKKIVEILAKSKKPGKKPGKAVGSRPDGRRGREDLLDVINYDFMRSDGNGNCYYNSIGMLTMAGFNKQRYEAQSIDEQNDIQFREQTRVRRDLTEFARAIYDRIQGFNIDSYLQQNRGANVVMIRYLLNNGPNFGIINHISRSVDARYYGSENEIYFTSLMYERPVVSLPGIEDVTRFDIIWFENYRPNGQRFIEYVRDPATSARMIVDFLAMNARRQPQEIGDTIEFLIGHPNSYIIVGGRGHWSYALPRIARQAGGTIENSTNHKVIMNNKTRKNTSTASIKFKLSKFGVNKDTRRIKMNKKTKKINYGTVQHKNKHMTRKHKRR